MAQLGRIFPDEPTTGPRGVDLRVSVEVPRYALGAPDGYKALVPRIIHHDGQPVERVTSPFEHGDEITLNLPEHVPDGATLRLRGQGGPCEAGTPGDLYVEICLVDRDPPEPPIPEPQPLSPMMWIVLGIALAITAWLAFKAMAG